MTPHSYNQLNQLLADHSRLSAELAGIESDANLRTLRAVTPLLPTHAETKAAIGEIEGKVRAIAVANPELFPEDKKTHTTPFGAISFRTTSFLEIEDEEKAMLKIKLACEREMLRATRAGTPPLFTEDTLLRTKQECNLEALEKLDDAQLALFGIARKSEEKFSLKPLEVKADKLSKKATKEKVDAAKN
jgi:hypothetical protein